MLDGYVSEKEQIESIRKWWDDNGKYLAMAILIGLAIGFAWRYWQKVQIRYAENAAMIYQSILDADQKNNDEKVQGGANLLEKKFSNTPYASLAGLLSAKKAIANNDETTAITQLNWVTHHTNEPRLKTIAQLSLARIYLSEHKPKEALAEIKSNKDKAFTPLIDWIKGDIYSQQQDVKKAQDYYLKAKNSFAEFPTVQSLVTQQLAN